MNEETSSLSLDSDPHLIHLLSVSNLTKNYLQECLHSQAKPNLLILKALKKSEEDFREGDLLDFSSKQLVDSDIFPLLKALEYDQYFTKITVRNNKLQNLEHFEELIAKNPMISEISFENNRFDPKKLRKISETLEKNKQIKKMMDFSNIKNYKRLSGARNQEEGVPGNSENGSESKSLRKEKSILIKEELSGINEQNSGNECSLSNEELIEDTQEFEEFQEVKVKPRASGVHGDENERNMSKEKRERSEENTGSRKSLPKAKLGVKEFVKMKEGTSKNEKTNQLHLRESRKISPPSKVTLNLNERISPSRLKTMEEKPIGIGNAGWGIGNVGWGNGRSSLSPKGRLGFGEIRGNAVHGSENSREKDLKGSRVQPEVKRPKQSPQRQIRRGSPPSLSTQNQFKTTQMLLEIENRHRNSRKGKESNENTSLHAEKPKSFYLPSRQEISPDNKKTGVIPNKTFQNSLGGEETKSFFSLKDSRRDYKSTETQKKESQSRYPETQKEKNTLESNRYSPRNAFFGLAGTKNPETEAGYSTIKTGEKAEATQTQSSFNSKGGSKKLTRMKWIMELQSIFELIKSCESTRKENSDDENQKRIVRHGKEATCEERGIKKKRLVEHLSGCKSSFLEFSNEKSPSQEPIGITFTIDEILDGLKEFPRDKMDQDDLFELVSGLKKAEKKSFLSNEKDEIMQTPKKAKRPLENQSDEKEKEEFNEEFINAADSAESGFVNLDDSNKKEMLHEKEHEHLNRERPRERDAGESPQSDLFKKEELIGLNEKSIYQTCSTTAKSSSQFDSKRQSHHRKTDSAAPQIKGFESGSAFPLVVPFDSSKTQREGTIGMDSERTPKSMKRLQNAQIVQRILSPKENGSSSRTMKQKEENGQMDPKCDQEASNDSLMDTSKFQSPAKSKTSRSSNQVSMTFGKNGQNEMLRISFSKPFPNQEGENSSNHPSSNSTQICTDSRTHLHEAFSAAINNAKTLSAGGQNIKGFIFKQESGSSEVEETIRSDKWLNSRSEMVIMRLENCSELFTSNKRLLVSQFLFHERLQVLSLLNCGITSLFGLFQFPHIVFLNASGNRLESLEGINSLPYLQELIVRRNSIKSIESIKTLQQLALLDLSDNSLCEYFQLVSLVELKSLKTLVLKGNPVTFDKDYSVRVPCFLHQVQNIDDEKSMKASQFASFEEFCCLEEAQNSSFKSLLSKAHSSVLEQNQIYSSQTPIERKKESFSSKRLGVSPSSRTQTREGPVVRSTSNHGSSREKHFGREAIGSKSNLEESIQLKIKRKEPKEIKSGQNDFFGQGSPKKKPELLVGPRRPGLIIQNIHINSLGMGLLHSK